MEEKINFIEKGIVYKYDEQMQPYEVGKIAYVELTIEHPENMIGISRVANSRVYDDNDNQLLDDQKLVDNTEYHSDNDLIKEIAKYYNLSTDFIKVDYYTK